ncbi:PspC domain-containing protein [Bifidobacterium aerophilum]|nr:PspC domain-containing protein [Bifidobacterium aerophilum]
MSNSYGPYAPQDGGASQYTSGPQPGAQPGPQPGNPYDPSSYPYNAYPHDAKPRDVNGACAKFFGWIRRSGIIRSDDRWVGGVCGGLARYFNISPVLMRAIMVAAMLCGGFGAALYAFAWFLLPDERDGGMLCERLIAGDWDWACLGVGLCFVIGVGLPGAGIIATATAAFVLWLIVERELRRQRGYGAGRPNSGNPGGFTGNIGIGDPRTGCPNDSGSGDARSYGQSGTYSNVPPYQAASAGATPASPAGAYPFASPASGPSPAPSGSPFVAAGSADAVPDGPAVPMTSPYRAPQPKPVPIRARRKPAGPLVVAAVIGLACIFAAIALYLTNDYTLTSLIRSATLWIGATCVLVGLVILVLGIRGRRAGGLVPLAWLAGITALCVLTVNLSYGYIASHYADAYRSYETVSVHGYVDYDGSIAYSANDLLDGDSAQFKHLSDGVVFDGSDYDNDLAHIDLSGYARRPAHAAKLHNGTTVRTNCPSGTIHLAALQTRVVITLPTGCPFAFGNDDLSTFGGNAYGGRYAALVGTQSDGINLGSSTFAQQSYLDSDDSRDGAIRGRSATDGLTRANGADAPAWLRDYDYYPADGTELFIDVKYLLSGRVFVRYPDRTVGDNADLFGAKAAAQDRDDD